MTSIGMRIAAAVLALATAGAVGMTVAWAQAEPAPTTQAKDQAKAAFERANALFNDGKFADALKEVDTALQLNPDLKAAIVLRAAITEKIAAAPATGPAATQTKPGEIKLMAAKDLSRIRIYEAGPKDKDIRTSAAFNRKDLETFWTSMVMADPSIPDAEKTAAARDKFLNPGNIAGQVALMRRLSATQFLDKITVVSDPDSMVKFRTMVQPFLLQNCAGCHTPAKANGYPIFCTLPSTATPEQTYTNFYMLTQYTYKGAKMLDRDNPDKSVLLQFGLPASLATTPHPQANGKPVEVRGRFADTNDPRFGKMVDWIKNSLAFPQPDYGVTWQPPAAAAPAATTTAPATEPATAP